MGKMILYIGLGILVFGVGPLYLASLSTGVSPDQMFFNSLGLGLLAVFSVWPGIIITSAGALICIFNLAMDRLPR
jgi:hypothetical protein